MCAARRKRVIAAELSVEIAEPGDVEISLVGHLVVEHRVGTPRFSTVSVAWLWNGMGQ